MARLTWHRLAHRTSISRYAPPPSWLTAYANLPRDTSQFLNDTLTRQDQIFGALIAQHEYHPMLELSADLFRSPLIADTLPCHSRLLCHYLVSPAAIISCRQCYEWRVLNSVKRLVEPSNGWAHSAMRLWW
jgi:hypothetical protein